MGCHCWWSARDSLCCSYSAFHPNNHEILCFFELAAGNPSGEFSALLASIYQPLHSFIYSIAGLQPLSQPHINRQYQHINQLVSQEMKYLVSSQPPTSVTSQSAGFQRIQTWGQIKYLFMNYPMIEEKSHCRRIISKPWSECFPVHFDFQI